MTTIGPITDAEDTWVNSAKPAKPYGSGAWVRVGGATRAGLLTAPIKTILGRTVKSAPLTFHVGPGHVGQTYTVKRITSDWSADDVTWNKKPSVSTTSVAATVSAQADGTSVTIDIYTLLQQVADGRQWLGLQITSDAGSEQFIYSTDSGQPAFELTIELSDDPEQAEGLFPDVGAVGASKVILGWRAPDLDGVTAQDAYKIQFSATDNWASPDSDTGWLTSSLPRHDMTAYSFALTAGANTGWRVKIRDASSRESDWSDPAHMTYDNALGVLVLDSPASTTIGDPTPRIQAHLTGGGETITRWRIRVAKGNDQTDVIYNSKQQPGDGSGLLDFQLPLRDPESGRRLFPDDQPRWLNVRVWGTKKRSVGEGRADYIDTWVLITATDSGAVTAPTSLTLTPRGAGDPRYTWSWQLPSAPNGVIVGAGSQVLARLDSDDWTAVSGTYTWNNDDGVLAPWQANSCWVRAVEDGARRSASSNVVTVTPQVEGLVIVSTDPEIDLIRLVSADTTGIQSVDTTSVAQKLDGSDYAVTYGPPWIKGPASGAVNTQADANKLDLLRQRPWLRPRVIWSSRSIRARISDLSPMPAGLEFLPTLPRQVATFTVTQVED